MVRQFREPWSICIDSPGRPSGGLSAQVFLTRQTKPEQTVPKAQIPSNVPDNRVERRLAVRGLVDHLEEQAAVTDFRVDLDVFRGPLDLLVFLVRQHEVEIIDVPVAQVTEQYAVYLSALDHLDVNAVGDFLGLASALVEMKSQRVLPHGDEAEAPIEDPRQELVRRLLEYKMYRDAASMLEERGRQWQLQMPRLVNDLTPGRRDLAEEPIREVELWDLVSAFARIMRDAEATKPSSIVYDDTPIHVFMGRIHTRLLQQTPLAFRQLFVPGMHKSTWVGIFLACLELARHGHVRLEQDRLFGEIWLLPGPNASSPLDLSQVDGYDHAPAEAS